MISSSIEKRISKLEHIKEKNMTKICITCIGDDYAKRERWAVPKDLFETYSLQEAVDHVKKKYHSKHIVVSEYMHFFDKMSFKELQKARQIIDPKGYNETYKYCKDVPKVPTNTKGVNDPFFDPLKKPSHLLKQVMAANPSIKFELGYYDIEKYWKKFEAANNKRKRI